MAKSRLARKMSIVCVRPLHPRQHNARLRFDCRDGVVRQYIMSAVLRGGGYSMKDLANKDKAELYKLRRAAINRQVRPKSAVSQFLGALAAALTQQLVALPPGAAEPVRRDKSEKRRHSSAPGTRI